MPFDKNGKWYPPDGWDDDWTKKKKQQEQPLTTQTKATQSKKQEGPSFLQRIGGFLSDVFSRISPANTSPFRDQLPENYDSLSFGEKARIAAQLIEQNRPQNAATEALQFLGQRAASALGLLDAVAFLQRKAGAQDAKPQDFIRDPNQAQHIPSGVAKGMEFVGGVLGTIPLAAGGALTTGRAAANIASRLLQNLPQRAARYGTSAAQGLGTGAFVGGVQQTLGELGDPDAATFGERLQEAAKTAGTFGLYGLAYPAASSALSRAFQALPQRAQATLRNLDRSYPMTSTTIQGTAEGGLAGSMVGAGLGAVEAVRTGDPTEILKGIISEAGQEAGEGLIESMAFGIARRLTGGLPQLSAQTRAQYVSPMEVQAQNAMPSTPALPPIAGAIPAPGETSGRFAEGVRRAREQEQARSVGEGMVYVYPDRMASYGTLRERTIRQQPEIGDNIYVTPTGMAAVGDVFSTTLPQPEGTIGLPAPGETSGRYAEGVRRAREAAETRSVSEEPVYVYPDRMASVGTLRERTIREQPSIEGAIYVTPGGEAIVGSPTPPVPNVGDRVRLRGLRGEYTVTGSRGPLVELRSDDGKTYTAHVRAVEVIGTGSDQTTPEKAAVASETTSHAAVQQTTQTPQIQGAASKVKTERGTEVETQFAVVNADSLITSHDTSLRVNPDFPAELQPRDRSRLASEQQVRRIATKLEPEFLAESPKASEGAPIVGPDMVVESGNARTIAVKRAYERNMESAKKYKDWLIQNAERFGLDPEQIRSMEKPVLVRIRRSDVDRVRFVQEANEQSVAAMSATEQAIADANNLTTEIMDMLRVDETGNINNIHNQDFINNFMQRVVGPAEMGRYIDRNGRLSQEGLNRIRNAVFAKAYGDVLAIEKLAESTDNNVKNITNAMLMAAPRISKIKEGIESGRYYNIDITPDLVAAMNKLSELRDEGMSVDMYLRQMEMFEELSPLAKEILAVFDANKRSAKKINAILQAYADVVEAQGSPDQLGLFETKPPTPEEAWVLAVKTAERDGVDGLQATLFEAETGRNDGDGAPTAQLENQAKVPKAEAKAVGDTGQKTKRETIKQNVNEETERVEQYLRDLKNTLGEISADGIYSGREGALRLAREIGASLTDFSPEVALKAARSAYIKTVVPGYRLKPPIDAKEFYNEVINRYKEVLKRDKPSLYQEVIEKYPKELLERKKTPKEKKTDDDNEKILSFALGQAYQKMKAKEGETKGEAFSWSGTVPNSGGTKYKLTPKAAKEIADIMANALDTVLRPGKTSSRRSLGEFLPRAGVGRVRKQYLHNWRVVGHELGHAFSTKTNFAGDAKELEALADRLYPAKINDPDLKREEGLAEFFQLYFVDPAKAREWAPNTVKEFESFLEENEILANAVSRIRTIVENDLEGTPIERGMRTILPYGSKPKEEQIGQEYKMNTFKRALFNVVDFTIPFQDMMKEAIEKGYSGINVAKFVAMTGNNAEKARRNFTHRATDHLGRYIAGEPLKKIADEAIGLIEKKLKSTGVKFKGYNGDTSSAFQVFDTILHAARYHERASRGHVNNPIDPETAKAIIKQAEEMFPGIMDYVKRYTETLSNIILTKLERAGVITPETRKRIEAGSSFYIPTYYATREPLASGASEGRRTARQPVKRYDGKQQMTLDFLTSTMIKLAEVEQVIEYKRTLDAIEEALRLPGMGKFGVIEKRPVKAVKVSAEELAKKVEKLLNESISEEEIGSQAITIFLPGGLNDLNKKDPVIMNWHGDKQTYMRLSVDLFEALMAMGPVQTSATLKMLARASSWFRYFSLTTPRYFTNALARDLFTAAIQRKAPGSIIKAMFRGATLAAGVDPKFMDQYINSGAFFSSAENVLQSMSRSSLTDGLLQTDAPGWKRTTKGIFYFIANKPGDFLRWQEQIFRTAEFLNAIKEAAKKHGIDYRDILDGDKPLPEGMEKDIERILVDAAYAASEVTTNFNLRGASGLARNVFPTVPFLHGTIQGLYREARQVAKNPGQTAFRIMMYLVPVTLAAFWFMKQTGEDDDTPSEFRDKYWVFPWAVGEEAGTIQNPRFRIAVAKPFTYALPVNLLERYLDWLTRETDAARKPLEDLGSLFGQTFGIRMLPSVIAPFLAIYANKTDFGTPIVPRGEELLAKELQYGPETSELAKKIAAMIASVYDDPTKGPSPRQIDYLLKNIMGNLGRYVLDITDRIMGKEGKSGTEYMPIIGSLLYGYAEGGSRIMDRFYKDYERAQTLNSTAKKWLENYARTGKKPAVKLTEEQIRLVIAKPVMDTYADILSQLRKDLKAIELDPTIDPALKSEARIKATYFEKVVAGRLYGYMPQIPPNSGITDEQVLMFIDMIDQEANRRLQNSIKREGGPQENAAILQFLSSLQQ